MKTPFLLLAAVCCAALTSGCALNEKYTKNSSAGQAWLQSNDKGSARVNVEGVYYSPDWGVVVLNQSGKDVTGAIAYYKVKGIVSGKSAYLLLVDDDWITKTAVLTRRNSEVLVGGVSSCVPFCAKNQKPVHLDRIVQ